MLSPTWAFLAHGERAGPWTIAGGAIVLAATAAQMAYTNRRSTLPAAA